MGKSNKNETPEAIEASGVDSVKETTQKVVKSPVELENETLKAEVGCEFLSLLVILRK